MRAFGVAAVLGQQHPDVHLVGLALQVGEEAPHAVPLLAPLPVAVAGLALQHPMLLLGRELHPGGVARDALLAGQAHQVLLALGPGRCLKGLDGAAAQGLLRVGDDQAPVHADHPTEAAAVLAGADRRVEAEQRRRGVGVAPAALGAVQAAAPAPDLAGFQVLRRHQALAARQAGLDGLHQPCRLDTPGAETVGDDVDARLPLHLARGS
jgi:hypothetical protein